MLYSRNQNVAALEPIPLELFPYKTDEAVVEAF